MTDPETAAPPRSGTPPTPRRVLVAVAVAGVVVCGVVLRCWTRSDLWLDEALSVDIARLPFGSIGSWLRHDGAPPLYYWMLHGWTAWFGTGDAAVRSLSSVAGILSLPAAWWCGRRIGGPRLAWVTVLVLASNPYAIRYATEARMYGFEILTVFVAIAAVRAAIERATVARLALVAACAAVLVWTHYWCLSLVAAGWLIVVFVAWRGTPPVRTNAIRTAVAIALGAATFAAWLANFLYQSAHTGTPWATPQLPPVPMASSVFEFAGGWRNEGWILFLVVVVLVVIGVFGRSAGPGTVTLDVHTRSPVAPEAALAVLGLGLATSVAYLGGSGFQPRYSAMVLPCVVLVVAHGITVLHEARTRVAVISLVVVCGLIGGARNVTTQRTQAGLVARSIAARAHAGDVVVYCPDQLGPATHRVLQRTRTGAALIERSYPVLTPAARNVALIDWVDYVARLDAVTPERAAAATVAAARPSATIWVVTSPGYITHDSRCMPYLRAVASRTGRTPREIVAVDPDVYEHAGLYELAP